MAFYGMVLSGHRCRTLWDVDVAGSNPVTPTNDCKVLCVGKLIAHYFFHKHPLGPSLKTRWVLLWVKDFIDAGRGMRTRSQPPVQLLSVMLM